MTHTLLLAGLLFQATTSTAPVIDNERVTVWTEQQRRVLPNDSLLVTLSGSQPSTASVQFIPAGSAQPASGGSLVINFGAGGTTAAPQGRTLHIELKKVQVPPFANATGLPLAFPDRPGIKNLFENNRVIVWDYTWTLNKPTPMHFHDKDVVVMFLEEGDLQSTTPDGQKTVNPYKPGTIRFNARNRTHNEELIRGTQRAIIVELK